jgi:nucleotide-binding universal stress UspA family protein
VTRGFLIPGFPIPPLIAIAANSALVLYTFTFNPIAVWTAFFWIVAGLIAYYTYFEHREALESPREVVHEEAVGRQDYTVLVAVRDEQEAATMGWFASVIAKARGGGILAAHMLEVPRPLSLNEGRALIETGRGYFARIREAADANHIATDSLIMIARRVGLALEGVVRDRAVDFIVTAWSGKTKRGRNFGRTIDPLLANPPADMAVIRPAAEVIQTVRTILVPVDDSANSRLAVELATDIGRHIGGRAHAAITLLRVTRTKAAADEGETELFKELLKDIDYRKLETRTQMGSSEANTIIEAAKDFDLVIFGASEESSLGRLFPKAAEKRFSARTAKRIISRAEPTTVMVKHRPAILRSVIQRIVVPK